MTESEVIYLLVGLVSGAILGVLLTLGFNKVRGGRVSAAGVRKEMDEYQAQVEAHFEETSKKFKSMAEQYKDLYQHMSVGATSLCRPDNIAAGLTDQSDPLQSAHKLEAKSPKETVAKQANQNDKSTEAGSQDRKPDQTTGKDKKPAENKTTSTGSAKSSTQQNNPKGNSADAKKAGTGSSTKASQKTDKGKSASSKVRSK